MKKILFIDDNDYLRDEIVDALKFEGFDLLNAGNGPDGIEMARTQIPHLILCDIRMSEMDGFEVCRKLKGDTVTASIPFIFLTAMAEADEIRKGMDLGADNYLIKPISLKDLLKAINLTISGTSQQDRIKNSD